MHFTNFVLSGNRSGKPWIPGDHKTINTIIMSVDELMNVHGNFQVTMSIGDLKEAFKQWSNDFKPVSNDETILTINEVCTLLGCDKSSLWRWDKMGILKKKRVGGKVVYLKCDIMDYLKGKEA